MFVEMGGPMVVENLSSGGPFVVADDIHYTA